MSALGQGSTVAGKYRLERLIGRGGMGSVWAARHLQLDTLVAVKFIDTVADMGDARIRFEREARAAAQLRSPHVVQILDHGIDDERPYIAMELLEGEDLGERLRRTPRLSLPATATIIAQASKALRRAHEHGVIHRDLKPGNIFLARFDDDEVVKLLDFGVAKLRYGEIAPGVQMTQTGVIFGSPSYMSPEQARGNRVIDHRTDLWSLAVILFRCLTGSKPFEAGSIGDLVIKLCIDPPPMPTRFAAGLPPEVDQFFKRAFARDPDQRFQSAMALAAEFEAIVARASASASIPPPQALPQAPPSIREASVAPSPVHPSLAPPSGATPAPPLTAPRIEATSTPLPSSAPTFQAPFPSARPAELPAIAPQPASMTPAPTLLPMGASGAAAPARPGLLAAASLGACAFVLLAIVIGVALHRRASSGSARSAEATESASSSSIVAPIAPPPAASAVALPPAPTTDEPAASAAPSASASGRKPGPGKAGRGRTPNFGY